MGAVQADEARFIDRLTMGLIITDDFVAKDDPATLRAATATPEYGRAKADDPNFVAPGPVPFIITTEHVIIG